MSIEQILLLVFFIVVPLIQYLLRVLRKQDEDEPQQAEEQPRPAQRRPPMREPQPSTPAQRPRMREPEPPTPAQRPPTWEPESPPVEQWPLTWEPEPPSRAPLPPVPIGPSQPATARHTFSDALAALQDTPLPNVPVRFAPPPTARRSARRGGAVVDLRNRFELHRAIVLMTILGPCRANNSYDWPESAGRQ